MISAPQCVPDALETDSAAGTDDKQSFRARLITIHVGARSIAVSVDACSAAERRWMHC
jgi:hypothetical protein